MQPFGRWKVGLATGSDEVPDGLHVSWFQSGTFMNNKAMVVAWAKPGVCDDVLRCIHWCFLCFFFATHDQVWGEDGEMRGTNRHINLEDRVDE